MATITTAGSTLAVSLARREKVAAAHRDIRVPLAAVREVRVEPDALAAVSGLRAPGLAIPGRAKIGVWRRRGRRQFVVARRGVPAVHVRLDGASYDELIVSTGHAREIAAQIRTAARAMPKIPEPTGARR
jgi:hypothetical protein